MVDTDVVTAKLAELSERLGRIRSRCPADAAALAADQDALELISFNLVLAIQTCLDIASHVIADEGFAPATSLSEAFIRLAEHGILAEETADPLARAAGLRNILVHVYAKVDPSLVHEAATESLSVLDRFATEISTWLMQRDS